MVELGVALVDGVERTPRTSFKSVGVAVQDWAIARLLAEEIPLNRARDSRGQPPADVIGAVSGANHSGNRRQSPWRR